MAAHKSTGKDKNQLRKIRYDYDVIETFEAGIELTGIEVKSIRTHNPTLDGAYIGVRGGEAFVFKMQIPPYQASNTPDGYEPERIRRVLLTKKEIRKLADVEAGKGLTIVPVKVYNKGRKIKLEVAIVRGKKKFDKREAIKKRESDRDIQRTLKGE